MSAHPPGGQSDPNLGPPPPGMPPPPAPPAAPVPQPTVPPPPAPYPVDIPYGPAGRTSGLAIASMVCGIVGLPMLCGYGAGLVLGILALVFGYRSRRQIHESRGYETGESMATAGIVLGWVVIGFSAVIVTFIAAVLIGNAVA